MNGYFLQMLLKVAVLMALAIPGFILKKTRLLPSDSAKGLCNILIYVAIPFLILEGFQSCSYTPELLEGILYSAIIALLSQLAMLAIGKVAFRHNLDDNRVARFAATFSNCGFFGYPVIRLLYPSSPEAIVYAVVYNAVFNVLAYTLGLYSLTGDRKTVNPLKALLSPVTVALVIALPLFFLNVSIETHAPTVWYAIELLAEISTPLSMIVMGVKLAELKPKKYLSDSTVYAVSVLKLITAPVITLLMALIVRLLSGSDPTVCVTMTVMAAMPTATMTIAMSESYGKNSELASVYVVTSAILSIVTIPLIAYLLTFI